MAEPQLAMMADGGADDLPRTFRRAREEQREREAQALGLGQPVPLSSSSSDGTAPMSFHDETHLATVRRIDVPFVHLVMFFLKAVLAAIPALILLGIILWVGGHLLQSFFPQLVKMQILIRFPQ